MASNRIVVIILSVIFSLALILRVYKLSEFPVGFHIDEASLGYNGYSLLLTGRDDNNQPFPLYVDMFGDNRPSGYHYLTVIPIKIFGLSEFSTRLPGALFGSLSIFTLFFLIYAIFESKKLALLGAFLLAITPWHIVLSKASAESIVALFFILLGTSLIIESLKRQNIRFLTIGAFLSSLSFFFYHTPRLFVPLLFISIFLVVFKTWKKASVKFKQSTFILFFLLCFISFSLIFLISGGTGRFSQVNIFTYPSTKLIMEEEIREDGVNQTSILLTRSFHNKLINYSLIYITNYLEYFEGKFLFIKGGLPIWYQVPNMGLFYIVSLPFILIGLTLLATHKNHLFKIPVVWMIVAPLTSAITIDDIPNINRAVVLLPMFEIFTAFGFLYLISKFNKPLKSATILIIGVLLLWNISYFLHQYFIHAKIHNPYFRNNGFKEMIGVVKNSYDDVNKVVITKTMGGIYPLVLFHMQYDPKIYQQEGSPKDRDYAGFGKFFFVPQACPSINRDNRFPNVEKILFVNKGDCPDVSEVKYTDIYREDGSRAFRISYE